MAYLKKHRLLLAAMLGVAVLAALVVTLLLPSRSTMQPTVLGQAATPTPIPGCPEGEHCFLEHVWPPFTAVFEQQGSPVTFTDDPPTTVYPTETMRLEYRSDTDWRLTTLAMSSSDPRVGDRTGSWESQDGLTYTLYRADLDYTHTETLQPGEIKVPARIFAAALYVLHDFGSRTDGTPVVVETDICEGSACHVLSSDDGASGAVAQERGREYPNDPRIPGVLTNDEWKIPLKYGLTRVLELQLQPTTADPMACVTNLRRVYVQDGLEQQGWSSTCASANQQDATAHYYTFEVRDDERFTIRADSSDAAIQLHLLEGARTTGSVLAEHATDGASGTSQATSRRLDIPLEAGTYTVEVSTTATSGTFDVTLEVPKPTPVPTPQPPVCIQPFPNPIVITPRSSRT